MKRFLVLLKCRWMLRRDHSGHNRIAAIKYYRMKFPGSGLKETKDLIDSLCH